MQDEASDSLLESHELFKTFIKEKSNEEKCIIDYLKHINYPAILDFPEGLEWFNVPEALSFTKHLKGKVVLLDFFTYCCINCMHILPDLKDIENEFSVEDGLVVIGVHSAKFDNEKDSKNILAAIQRYNISHPVLNDKHCTMWKNCNIQCWPTLLLLGPKGNPIILLSGEGHRETLHLCIRALLSFYTSKGEISNHKIPSQPAYHLLPPLKGPLLFPGKIACFNATNSEIIAISDTGNHRILIIKNDGTLLEHVGGGLSGFKDGNLEDALFNAPQGLVFKNSDVLFVADTENHAVRMIDLNGRSVTTVAGTGEQGEDFKGEKDGKLQEISSPWDVAIYKTNDLKEVLFIAMAGTHQIWALFLDDIVWWKKKQYKSGTCVCIAGSGREENRNNQYPHAAAFAQPSGLVICHKNKEIYIADSESSSIRRLSLVDGKVTAVVGGDRNPSNLFAYGDKDGKLYEAKLQHVLGLAMSKDEDFLFIADTYNHKIKKVEITTNSVSTIPINEKFNEPGGLCTSSDGKRLYIADTNNHCIKVLNIGNENIMCIERLSLKLDKYVFKSHTHKKNLEVIEVNNSLQVNNSGGKLIIKVYLILDAGLKLANEAPQRWHVDLPNAAWSCTPTTSGSNVTDIDVVLSLPSVNDSCVNLDFVYNIVTCMEGMCIPKAFIIRQHLDFNNSPLCIDLTLNVALGKSTILVNGKST